MMAFTASELLLNVTVALFVIRYIQNGLFIFIFFANRYSSKLIKWWQGTQAREEMT